jgi:hypothetical protein
MVLVLTMSVETVVSWIQDIKVLWTSIVKTTHLRLMCHLSLQRIGVSRREVVKSGREIVRRLQTDIVPLVLHVVQEHVLLLPDHALVLLLGIVTVTEDVGRVVAAEIAASTRVVDILVLHVATIVVVGVLETIVVEVRLTTRRLVQR